MEVVLEKLEWFYRYLLMIEFTDLLDIAILSFLIYKLLSLVKRTNSEKLLKGVLLIILALIVSDRLRLNSLNFVLGKLVEWGVLALIILFQPEIRRILEQLGGSRFSFMNVFNKSQQTSDLENAIRVTAAACADMSKSRTGALIVFERKILLDDVLRSGTKLDAIPSPELLKNIFFVKAPMHDGALIMREGRVLGAGCMLPLSRNVNLSRDLGMRHRAGIGMSENSDAVVVLVSEETGTISVAVGGMLKRHLALDTLQLLLENELLPKEEAPEEKHRINLSLRQRLSRKKKDGESDE